MLAAFSSTGPCDDGRIKPDVVGNGVELLSSYSTNDSSYAIASGTSMASPNVCGSLGLIADYYRDTHGSTPMWASTLKALAIHTALEAGSNPGPDYLFGWGLLNAYAAYKIVNKDYLDDAKGFVEQLTLNQGQTIEIGYRVNASTPELRATICWNDPAGTPPAPSLNPRTRMLVNDLDLRAVKGVDTYYPWRLDVYNPANAATKGDNNVDNVEQVVVATPTPGVYMIRITHKGTLYGGSQKVSLVVSGAEKNHSWHVYADGSGDAPTIAAAVAAAVDGDSIFVHQGTYPEAGISISKALVITGVDGAALTTVDGAGLGSGIFTFPAASKVIRIRDLHDQERIHDHPRRRHLLQQLVGDDRALRHREIAILHYSTAEGSPSRALLRRSETSRSFRIRPITTEGACTSRRRARSSIRAYSTITSPPAPAARSA